jgi:stage II sporulation protein AA (anti-sigma F factor antagonist)
MTQTPFEVRTDAEGVYWLSGELDLAQADRFLETSTAHLDGQREVVLDCSRLTFLDSSGIRAFLTFASKTPGTLVIRDPTPTVRKVLEIAGVDQRTGVRIESDAG